MKPDDMEMHGRFRALARLFDTMAEATAPKTDAAAPGAGSMMPDSMSEPMGMGKGQTVVVITADPAGESEEAGEDPKEEAGETPDEEAAEEDVEEKDKPRLVIPLKKR